MQPKVTKFLDKAFGYQTGQFHPERHQENLAKLASEFTEYDEHLIDCLYRISVHLGSYTEELASKIFHRHLSQEDALSQLEITFFHFSKGTREWALEDALSTYTLSQKM